MDQGDSIMRVRSCSHHQFKTIALQFFQPIALILMLAAAASAQGQAPVILKPPQGTAILVGSTTALNVQASGTNPLTYQWLFNSNPLPNATASSYTISNIQKANEGDYRVIVGSTSGSVTSVVARVTVVAADIPTITDELVAHFIFDGNLNDSTSHSNNGTPVGAPNYTQTGKSS